LAIGGGGGIAPGGDDGGEGRRHAQIAQDYPWLRVGSKRTGADPTSLVVMRTPLACIAQEVAGVRLLSETACEIWNTNARTKDT
jgi:hypothetical protein